MDERLIHEFCLEGMIPGIHRAFEKGDDEVLDLVIRKANRDVLIGARWWDKEYSRNTDYYKKKVLDIIKETTGTINSGAIICNIYHDHENNAKVGIIQKLVNMAMKYLYVLDKMGHGIGIKIDFKQCDCPLDSRILEELSKRTGKTYGPWTKLETLEKYLEIQDDISRYSKEECSNLDFDFNNWI